MPVGRSLVPTGPVELVNGGSTTKSLLDQIRPAWQAKSLIGRVRTLLEIDPSSACQRLFNAAIHDLRDKVAIAGLDIAGEAAKNNGLPIILRHDDVENYPPAKLIDLAYRMGLLSRPEWRRVHRCYEIRRDLEHEDDEYEAGPEDCFYIFTTCIEVILARDPIQVLRVTDIKHLVEQSSAVAPSASLLDDYDGAPQPRQEEINKFLISNALNKSQSDIVQQNSFALLAAISPYTKSPVRLTLASYLTEKIGRAKLEPRLARVAFASGVFPYLRQSHRSQFFEDIFINLTATGHQWTSYAEHGEVLRGLLEFGGVEMCPEPIRANILKWICLLYIGEAGGQTRYGNVRNVFYSNSGAPLAKEVIRTAHGQILDELRRLKSDRDIARLTSNQHLARRFEELIDIAEKL